jgi:hypothetical protein
MTYDGVPGGFAFIADGGMLPTNGPGGLSDALPCGGEPLVSTGGTAGAAGLGTGGLGCAQAAAKAPTAITLSQVRVTSVSLPIKRRFISIEYSSRLETAKSRDVSIDAALPCVDLHRE